jgi:hypothetical protein
VPVHQGHAHAVAAVLFVVTMALSSSVARAADTVVDFEKYPIGTIIKTQYGFHGTGVGFGMFRGFEVGPVPTVSLVPGQTQSGVHAGDICAGCGGEFPSAETYGSFGQTRHFVRVFVGSTTTVTVHLQAYDFKGAELALDTKVVPQDGNVKTRLEVSDAAGRIAFFRVFSDDNFLPLWIDDVTFDNPAVAAQPDFLLNAEPYPFLANALAIPNGASQSLTLHVERINGSSGPLSFSTSQLPVGLTATLKPNNVSNPTSVKATFTAAPGAATFGVISNVVIVAKPTTDASNGPGKTPRVEVIKVRRLAQFDLQVNGIEVTQGIQTIKTGASTLPAGSGVSYSGVTLVANAKTIVRVFANLKQPANVGVDDVPALLSATKNGKPLPGSPLTPDRPTLDLVSGPSAINIVDRASGNRAYEFTLPNSWTSGSIALTAKVTAPDVVFGPTAAECPGAACADNNSFTLKGVTFANSGFVKLGPIAMTASGDPPLPMPAQALADAVNLTPVATDQVRFSASSYLSTVDITDINAATTKGALISDCEFLEDIYFLLPGTCSTPITNGDDFKTTLAWNRLSDSMEEYEECHDDTPNADWCPDIIVGMTLGVARGLSDRGMSESQLPVAVVQTPNRPLTSVAHELGHAIGRPHASSCNGALDAEPWPPDQLGLMQGVGLDRRVGSGGAASRYRVIVPRDVSLLGSPIPSESNFNPPTWIDFMSYCTIFVGPDLNSWISPKGWDDTFNHIARYNIDMGRISGIATKAAPQPPLAAVDGLKVSAFALEDGPILITKVAPEQGGARTPVSASAHHVRLTDAAGTTIADVPMAETVADINRGPRVLKLEAHVPLPGLNANNPAIPAAVTGLTVMRGSQPVMVRRRSAHAPTARFQFPVRGARVGARPTTVRWQAADPDGDALSVRVDYSPDNGRTWRTMFRGQNTRQARFARGAFAASGRARLRVVVNDGFDSATAISARFVALGRPPKVTIASPASRETLRTDSVLNLTGSAVDDGSRQLTGRALTWSLGRHRLGHGTRVVARGLRPGVRRIRLTAVDGRRRRSSAFVPIKVVAARPQFLTMKSPKRVSARARRLVLRVAASERARLTVGGADITAHRFVVSRRTRRVVLRVRPGARPLQVVLKVRAFRTTRLTVIIPRK